MSSTGLLTIPESSALLVGGRGLAGLLGLSATVRVVLSHFVLQPTLGIGLAGFGLSTSATTGAFTFTPGLALGAAFRVTGTVALTPMLRNDYVVIFAGSAGVAAFVTVLGEIPVAIFLGRNGFIEPFVNLGAAILTGAGRTDAVFAFGLGYRLGVVF